MILKRILVVFLVAFLLLLGSCFDLSKYDPKPYVRPLEVVKLSDKEYIHISYLKDSFGGYTPNNGFIRIEGNEAVIFDTPINDSISRQLINYIQDDLQAKVSAVILSNYHKPAAGGIKAFSDANIASYASEYTAEKLKDSISITTIIKDSITFWVGDVKVEGRYFGAAYSKGDLISYIEKDSTLFGGRAIEPLSNTRKNSQDSNLQNWSTTVKRVKEAYPDVQKIIPGYGAPGDKSLIDHTIKKFSANSESALEKPE